MTSRQLYNGGGQRVGQLQEGVFFKVIHPQHFLQRPPAIAVDAETFDQVIAMEAHTIRCYCPERDTTYESSVENFIQYRGELNRGHGRQYFLVLGRWTHTTGEQARLF